MAATTPVYAWVGLPAARFEVPGLKPHNRQLRFVVAAPSRAAAMRAAGINPRSNFVRDFVGETGNKQELEVALAKPGQVFAAALDAHPRVYVEVPEEFLIR